VFDLVRRRLQARRDRRRQRYLANLATMSDGERWELERLEDSLKTGSYYPRSSADQPWDEKGVPRDSN